MPLPNLNKEFLKDNPLASQLGIKGTNTNMLQFYNRFAENNILQDRSLSTVLARPYLFETIWSFNTGSQDKSNGEIERSNVERLLMATLNESNTESLKYFIQNIIVPEIDTYAPGESVASEFGMSRNPGLFVKPSSNEFTIQFLSTEFSLHESVFYYWLRETTSNVWVYKNRPFTKAKLLITFLDSRRKHRMFSYLMTNVFPLNITTLKPSQENEMELTRDVTFAFDNMYVIPASEKEQNRLELAFDKYIGDKVGRAMTTGVNKKLPEIPGKYI